MLIHACIYICEINREFELRIQTDGSITPKEALLQCCRDLVAEFGKVSREFTKEYELAKMAGENGAE